jgi:hypothetical protein
MRLRLVLTLLLMFPKAVSCWRCRRFWRDATRELATKITQPLVFAAVGDVWATTRPNAPLNDPRLQSLFGIMRSADMTYANMEGPIIDYGAYHRSEPDCASINMVRSS